MAQLLTHRFVLLLCLGLVTFTLILRQLQPYLSSSQSHAFSPPAFKRSWSCHQPRNTGQPTRQQKRVAIIGAGSAGSSAAYYLRNFTGDCYDLTIDVFERNDYIGGRSTTVDVFDDPAAGITAEVGGSIFVEVNHNLVAAARRFGLKTSAASFEARQKGKDKSKGKGKGRGSGNDEDEAAADRFGVWDGERFVFTQPANEAYWRTVIRMLWRYGLSPLRTQALMRSTVGAFLRLYDEPFFPFAELSEAVMAVGLTNATAQTGSAFLAANGIAAPFSTDLIQASTRVNYAQNLAQIHGVETMVCMATDGAMAVEGGNWRIFEAMLAHAEAAVHLNNTVTAVRKVHGDDGRHDHKDGGDAEGGKEERGGSYYEITVADSADASRTRTLATRYDDVVIAGPYQYSGISLLPHGGVAKLPDPIEYVQLHVTLFTTPYRLQPEYFGLNRSEDVPGTILTTLPNNAQCLRNHRTSNSAREEDVDNDSYEKASTANECSAAGPRDFLSISTLAKVTNPQTQEDAYLYKIFSHQPVRAGLLQRLFLGTQIPADGDDGMRARAVGANSNNKKRDKAANARETNGEHAVAAAAATATAMGERSGGNGDVREEAEDGGERKVGGQGGGDEYDPEVGPGVEDGVTAWRHVKVWHSYPYLPPRVTFEEPVLGPGLWYTAGIESFISTMETSSLMGMNVAALAVKRWREQEESGSATESDDGSSAKDVPLMHADRPIEL